MRYNEQQKTEIWRKTSGKCHICRRSLLYKAYGFLNTEGAWEIDHDIPKSKGGQNDAENLLPACPSCNRIKRDNHTLTERSKFGYKSPPYSVDERREAKIRRGKQEFADQFNTFLNPKINVPLSMLRGAIGYFRDPDKFRK